MSDLKLALRSLVRRPLFAGTVVLTLAIGLGAGAAMLHVVDAVLLRTLPYPEPDRLMALYETVTRDRVERRTFSAPDFRDLEARTRSFDGVAAYESFSFTVRGDERAERVAAAAVSERYFDLLGVSPSLGPGFRKGPEPADPPEVILSHAYWESRFGSDPEVLDRTLEVAGEEHAIRGVLPADFVPLVDGARLWVRFEDLPPRLLENRGSRFHSALGRLAPTVGEEAARQELASLFRALEEEHPDDNLHYGADLESLDEDLFGRLRTPLWTLLAAVGLVLVVLCANLAGLLLAREARRSGETAVRRALGASGWHVARGRIVEVFVLAAVGAVLGLGLAVGLVRLLRAVDPIGLPELVSLSIGARFVAAGGVVLALLVVVLATVSVVVGRRRRGLAATLRLGTSRLPARQPAMTALLVAELALATVLSVGAALFLTTLSELRSVETGFDADRLAFVGLELPAVEEEGASRAPMRARLVEAIESLPGVESAGLTTGGLLQGGYSATVIAGEGERRRPDEPWDGATRVYRHLVSPGFFRTIGAPLMAGRSIEASDTGETPGVAVVSVRLARMIWGEESPVGRRFKLGRPLGDDEPADEVEWVEVVGVVGDIRHRSLVPDPTAPPEDPDVYFSLEQFDAGQVVAVASTELDAGSLLPSLRRRIEALSSEIALFPGSTGSERLASQLGRTRFASSLLSAFAGVGLLLSALGIWALVAYQVTARWREIGVRMAVGATDRRVVGEIVGRTGRWLAVGVVLGLVGAAALARVVVSQLYRVRPIEPAVYLATALAILAIGVLAAWFPARRAARLDPIAALRAE